jgi:hypothetical protein
MRLIYISFDVMFNKTNSGQRYKKKDLGREKKKKN